MVGAAVVEGGVICCSVVEDSCVLTRGRERRLSRLGSRKQNPTVLLLLHVLFSRVMVWLISICLITRSQPTRLACPPTVADPARRGQVKTRDIQTDQPNYVSISPWFRFVRLPQRSLSPPRPAPGEGVCHRDPLYRPWYWARRGAHAGVLTAGPRSLGKWRNEPVERS